MKIALLCDIDQGVYHVGDEAIAHATRAELTARGHEVRMVSQRIAYGPEPVSDPTNLRGLQFPWELADRTRYFAEIEAVLGGDKEALPAHDKIFEIISELEDIDAVIIGGGGALNSRYPWLLYERACYAVVAKKLGKPVILSGQSIGPELAAHDIFALEKLLNACTVAGVRDADSLKIATKIAPNHPALLQIADDAVLLGGLDSVSERNVIAATFGADTEPVALQDFIDTAATLLLELQHKTGADIELIPHMATPGVRDADIALHDAIAARLLELDPLAKIESLEIETAAASAPRTASAKYVVATRFHPIVFGALGARSLLALPLNTYGASRMRGALENAGLADADVLFGALFDTAESTPKSELITELVRAFCVNGERESAQLTRQRAQLAQSQREWWSFALQRLAAGAVPLEAGQMRMPVQPDHSFLPGTAPLARDYSAAPLVQQARKDYGLQSAEMISAETARVGIIVRTKDRPVLLDRALQDIAQQTYARYRVSVVNDQGDAGLVSEVIAKYQDVFGDRLQLLTTPAARGMEAASNFGIRHTPGVEYLVVHDDDDTWHPDFLNNTVAYLDAHPQIAAVHTRTIIIEERESGGGYAEYHRFLQEPELATLKLHDFMKRNRMVPISLLYRASVHETIGMYREDLPVVGDYAFHLELLQRLGFAVIDRPLAYWHHRPQSAGGFANSMFGASDLHNRYSSILCDEYFSDWVSQHGIGLPLFINKAVEREADRLARELAVQRAQLDELRELILELRASDEPQPVSVSARLRARLRPVYYRIREFLGR